MDAILKNNQIYPIGEITIPQGSGLVYEVIRVIDVAALFLDDHYERFINSAATKKAGLPGPDEFTRLTERFIQALAKKDFNIKAILEPASGDLYLFESPSAYPDARLYAAGVHTELLPYRREDPAAKIINPELTSLAQTRREETGAYELLLVDPQGNITEGARSNLFFVQHSALITPPLDSVLPGVTRQRIIRAARAWGIEVREVRVSADSLDQYDGAFLSGTSPKILPIASIGARNLASAELGLIRDLIGAFDGAIEADLESYRKKTRRP